MTLKEQLDAELSKNAELTTKLEASEKSLGEKKLEAAAAEKKATDAQASADKYKVELDAEQKAHAETKTKLEASEKDSKTAGGKAAEQLAAKGIAPKAKVEPGASADNTGDPVALWESYQAADHNARADMRAQHGEKLTAAAKAYDKAKAAGAI